MAQFPQTSAEPPGGILAQLRADHAHVRALFHAFAMLDREGLRLLLNRPGAGGAGQPDDLGRFPEPGGWNQFQIVVTDLEAVLASLTDAGVRVRTGLVEGGGGRQAVIEDPSGNAIELLEPPTG